MPHRKQTARRKPANLGQAIALWEKMRYPFKAYPRTACADVVFPGCALPSQYPRTTDALVSVARSHGAGVVFDCCGAPLPDWGRIRAGQRVTQSLRERLARIECRRLIVACPTCLAYLKSTLPIPCISIFQAFDEWGVQKPCGKAGAPDAAAMENRGILFIPCPDRASRTLETQVRGFGGYEQVATLSGAPCCGLKASAAVHGDAFAREQVGRVFAAAGNATVHTYCAACAGQFARMGHAKNVRHALSFLLGVDEAPDAEHAVANRARRALRRDLEPLRGGDDRRGGANGDAR